MAARATLSSGAPLARSNEQARHARGAPRPLDADAAPQGIGTAARGSARSGPLAPGALALGARRGRCQPFVSHGMRAVAAQCAARSELDASARIGAASNG